MIMVQATISQLCKGKNVNKRYLSDLVVCTYPFIVFDERSYEEMKSTNRVEVISYVITLLYKGTTLAKTEIINPKNEGA